MDRNKWIVACWWALIFGLIAVLLSPAPARADTGCNEWATMTQILVLRWQGDARFKTRSADDVKKELSKDMAGHPELPKALDYVDFAWKNREGNPVHVWKAAYQKCSAVAI